MNRSDGGIDRDIEPLTGSAVLAQYNVRFLFHVKGAATNGRDMFHGEVIGRGGLQRREARLRIVADADLDETVLARDHIDEFGRLCL